MRPAGKAQQLAEQEGVDIKLYQVIYDAIDDVKKAMVGMLAPISREKLLGKAEVRQVFNIPKAGTIAGCFVTEGKITRKAQLRLVRDSVVLYTGKVGSLRRFKDDVSEVAQGYECGISIEGYNDLKRRRHHRGLRDRDDAPRRSRTRRRRRAGATSRGRLRAAIARDGRIARVTLFLGGSHSLKDKRMVLRRVKDWCATSSTSRSPRWPRTTLAAGGARACRWWAATAGSPSRRSTRCCASSAAMSRSRTRRRSCRPSDDELARPRLQALGGVSRCRSGWNGWRARCAPSLGEVLARDEIKDPRVRGAGLITVTHVRVSGDLQPRARAVHGPRRSTRRRWSGCAQGLDHASGYFRQAIARRLRMKVAPAVTFEVDHVFEQAERVEKLLREMAAAHPKTAAAGGGDDDEHDDGGDDERGRNDDRRPATACWSSTSRSGRRRSTWCGRSGARRRSRRVGHGGTLDPLASGVLPICLGEATKLAQFLLDADKEYDVTVCFGVETDTYDAAGRGDGAAAIAAGIDEAAVRAALAAFRGRDRADAARLLGAQARRAPALRLRARRRGGRDRAARRGDRTSWS